MAPLSSILGQEKIVAESNIKTRLEGISKTQNPPSTAYDVNLPTFITDPVFSMRKKRVESLVKANEKSPIILPPATTATSTVTPRRKQDNSTKGRNLNDSFAQSIPKKKR